MRRRGGEVERGWVMLKSQVDANVNSSSCTLGHTACVKHAKTERDESSAPPLRLLRGKKNNSAYMFVSVVARGRAREGRNKRRAANKSLTHTDTHRHTYPDVPAAAGLLCQHQKTADGSSFRLRAAAQTPSRN